MRIFRSISQSHRYPKALQYSRVWKSLDFPNRIRVNVCESEGIDCSVSFLLGIGTQNAVQTRLYMELLKEFLQHPSFQYSCLPDRTLFSLNLLKNESVQVMTDLVAYLKKNPDMNITKDPDDYLVNLLYASCFPTQSTGSQTFLQCFTGENLIVTGKGLPIEAISPLELLPQGSKPLSPPIRHQPTMQIIENSNEDTEILIAYQAPPFSHPDYFIYKYIEHLMHYFPLPYIDTSKQYNYLYSLIGSIPGIYSHEVSYFSQAHSGMLVHLVNSNPLAATFAGAAIVKSMNRMTKEVTPKEMERAEKSIYASMLKEKSGVDQCGRRGEEVWTGKSQREIAEFVMNCTEEYLCGRIASWMSFKFPSVIIRGKVLSDNVIEGMFKNEAL